MKRRPENWEGCRDSSWKAHLWWSIFDWLIDWLIDWQSHFVMPQRIQKQLFILKRDSLYSILHLSYSDWDQLFVEIISVACPWLTVSQGVPLRDFMFALMCPLGKVNSMRENPLFNVRIRNWEGCCRRQSSYPNWGSDQGPGNQEPDPRLSTLIIKLSHHASCCMGCGEWGYIWACWISYGLLGYIENTGRNWKMGGTKR